jgi:hypothetical protein
MGETKEESTELHVFSDASEKAMAAVAYLICNNKELSSYV